MPVTSQKPADSGRWKPDASRGRVILLLSEAAVIFALLFVWIFSESVRESISLPVLFFYSFPAEFLVGLVPHEPILIYYGVHHPAWVVAAVAVVSTVMAEWINYALFEMFYGMPALKDISNGRVVQKVVDLFAKMPFTAIIVTGFSPIPFFPIRFLVVMTSYPLWKYLLAVFLSRAPRFWLLAFFGSALELSASLLTAFFVAMFIAVNIPAMIKLISKGFVSRNGG